MALVDALPFFSTLNDTLKSGRLGDIVTVEHRENVVYYHIVHSFVGGNWRNEALPSSMILAKCCHDFDSLVWNIGVPIKRLQSFGSLRHFRPENAPAGTTLRCTDYCPVAENFPYTPLHWKIKQRKEIVDVFSKT